MHFVLPHCRWCGRILAEVGHDLSLGLKELISSVVLRMREREKSGIISGGDDRWL